MTHCVKMESIFLQNCLVLVHFAQKWFFFLKFTIPTLDSHLKILFYTQGKKWATLQNPIPFVFVPILNRKGTQTYDARTVQQRVIFVGFMKKTRVYLFQRPLHSNHPKSKTIMRIKSSIFGNDTRVFTIIVYKDPHTMIQVWQIMIVMYIRLSRPPRFHACTDGRMPTVIKIYGCLICVPC